MTRSPASILALILILTLLPVSVAQADEDQRRAARLLRGAMDDHEAITEDRPKLPVPEGVDPRYDDRLPDVDPAVFAARTEALEALRERLSAIDETLLEQGDAIERGILLRFTDERLGELAHRTWQIPITNREGFHISFARMPEDAEFGDVDAADRYVARLQSFATHVAQQIANMRAGLSVGRTLPAAVLDGYEATITAHLVDEPEASAFAAPLNDLPKALPEDDRARLRRDGMAAIRDSVLPGYRAFHAFFADEYLPGARATLGASSLPDGEAFYAHRVRRFTTLDTDAATVHQTGLDEVARLRAEMQRVIDSLVARGDFEGDFAAFLDFLRTDPRFYVERPEDYLAAAGWITKRMDGALPQLFRTLPKIPYGLLEIPAFLAPKTTGAYYSLGDVETGRSGNYFLNVSKLDSRPLYILEALSLHEAMPGHHLQIMLAAENESIPAYRRGDGVPAFVEGWALYAERLGKEVGFYTDPYQDFGRLTYEIWRACRLVVDTGLHAFGWSRQQAIDYMAANTALSLHEVTTEVDRYIAWPGQALAYKMGEIEISRLRREAEQALGPRFDVRAFHDAVLGGGSVPLDVLRLQVERYVAEARETPDAALAQLIEEIDTFRDERNPLTVPEGVDRRYDDRMPAISEAHFQTRRGTLESFLARLDGLDRSRFSTGDVLDAGVLRHQLTGEIGELRHRSYQMPLSSREGFHIAFSQLPTRRSFRTVADFDGYIARLQSYGEYTDRQIALMRDGIRAGRTIPRAVLEGYERTIAAHVVDTPEESDLHGPLRTVPETFPQADRARILRDGRAAIEEVVIPAYARYLDFFTDTYLPAARTTLATADLPDGRAFYDHRIRRYTTLDTDAQTLHRTGLDEVARLRREMRAVIEQSGFEGDFDAFLAFLRSEPRFVAATEDDYMRHAAWVAKRMDGQLPKLFATLPRTPYGLRPMPAFIAPRASSGYYDHGEADLSRAGFMNLNTSKLAERPTYLIEALVFHEGAPGHHLQLMLARESDSISPLRRTGGMTAFVEGWALYAERLGAEVGFYDDPYSDFGRLTYEIWRACRLVVDTGLHALGWSRERANAYMAANTALSTYEVGTEVDRYISEPGQALAYKMGELVITRLRREAEDRLGDRFDLRGFHDAVLQHGAIPLDLLEERVHAWIASAEEVMADTP